MSLQFNQCIIAGNIARDPEVRYIGNKQTPVASFAVATNRRFKDSAGELKEEATFIDCEAWGQTAEFIGKHIAKGAGVQVIGRLKQETWTDQTTQKQRSKLRLVVDRCFFTDPKAKGATAHAEPAAEPHEGPGVHAASAPHDNDQPPF